MKRYYGHRYRSRNDLPRAFDPRNRPSTAVQSPELGLAALDEKAGLKVSPDAWQNAQSVKRSTQTQIVSDVSDRHIGESAFDEKRLMASGSPHTNMAFDLLQQPPLSKVL